MSYFTEWLIIINSVIATLAIGYFLNKFALRKNTAKAPAYRSEIERANARR